MNSLERKLVENSEKTVKQSESIVDEAKLLLSSNVAEELSTLNSIGLNQEILFAQDVQRDLIIRNSSKDKLGKQIVHIDEIKKLCLDYRLYMNKAREYMGTIPPDLGAELTRFCKDRGIAMPVHSDYSNFYIVAPPKMFKGYLSPIGVVGRAMEIAEENQRERIRKKNEDPILVYKVSDEYYAIVKSWGDDFTPLRRLYGFLTRRITMKWINFLANTLFVYLMIRGIIAQFIFFLQKDQANVALEIQSIWVACGIVFGIIGIIFLGLWVFNESFQDFRKQIIRIVTRKNERNRHDD